jgi:hypothetical protein
MDKVYGMDRKEKTAYNIFMRKPNGKETFRKLRSRWNNNIKIDLRLNGMV